MGREKKDKKFTDRHRETKKQERNRKRVKRTKNIRKEK